ncbi:unnamed protein product [Ostreobium quekettii]|uniref:Uncharacterized protein n=1 Tax=Ostreobium quekettii TaxID=121088 RepID=A0A8S1IZ78_9CHLO|nr:unnamed protein product [Ostreobium quekettii]
MDADRITEMSLWPRDGSLFATGSKRPMVESLELAGRTGSIFTPHGSVTGSALGIGGATRASHKASSILELLDRSEQQDVLHGLRPSSENAPSASLKSVHHHHPGADDALSAADTMSVTSMASLGKKSAQLAHSVYEGFQNRIRKLEEEQRGRDATIVALHKEMEISNKRHQEEMQDAAARLARELEALQNKHDAQQLADRESHMQFIDRLLADKANLEQQCQRLACELKEQSEKHLREVTAMKEGWRAELKRQRDGWNAAEKVRRQRWTQAQLKEIKEKTIRALEPQVTQMAEDYKSQARRLQERLAAQEAMVADYEKHTVQLRDRLLKVALRVNTRTFS